MVKDDLSLCSTPRTPWTAAGGPRHLHGCTDHRGDREGLRLHAPPSTSWWPPPLLATAPSSFMEDLFTSRNSRQ